MRERQVKVSALPKQHFLRIAINVCKAPSTALELLNGGCSGGYNGGHPENRNSTKLTETKQ